MIAKTSKSLVKQQNLNPKLGLQSLFHQMKDCMDQILFLLTNLDRYFTFTSFNDHRKDNWESAGQYKIVEVFIRSAKAMLFHNILGKTAEGICQ